MKRLFFLLLLLTAYIAGHSQDAEKFFKSAETKYNQGKYQDAIADYTKCIELNPDHPSAHYRRGFVYSILKDYENAIKDYTIVINKDPNHLWAYISRGSAYNKLNKFQMGLDDFNKALSIDPKNQEAYNNRGWSKKGLGDQEGACGDWKTSKKMGNGEAKLILKNSGCK